MNPPNPNLVSAKTLGGIVKSYTPFVLTDIAKQIPGQVVVHVTAQAATLTLLQEVVEFINPEITFLSLPGWDCLPYDRVSPHKDIMAQRLGTIQQIHNIQPEKNYIVGTTASALLQRLCASKHLKQSPSFSIGKTIEVKQLIAILSDIGYVRADTVRESGEFAVRGGLIDIYPGNATYPVRVDLFGDEIESIKRFDPISQRTIDKIDHFSLEAIGEVKLDEKGINLFKHGYKTQFGSKAQNDPLYQAISEGRPFPGMEHWLPLFYESLDTVFDHLDQAIFTFDPDIEENLESRYTQIAEYYQARKVAEQTEEIPYRPIPPEQLYLDKITFQRAIGSFPQIIFKPFVDELYEDKGSRAGYSFAAAQKSSTSAIYTQLQKILPEAWQNGRNVLVTAYTQGSRDRIETLLKEHGLEDITKIACYADIPAQIKQSIFLAILPLDKGFRSSDLVVITEEDLLGQRLARPHKRTRRSDLFISEATALNPGDLLVHEDHGIGRFIDLTTVDAGQAPHDCVCLEYAGGDKLFVPVENLEVLSRFGGQGTDHALDKLGGAGWQARKAKAKKRIKEIAEGLVKLAAERALHQSDILEVQTGLYNEFCSRFPYPETDDQERSIADVIQDMVSGKPMDRLVCGDVGFGKTEVALRAAFVAASTGKQVAVIAPTTLLARQHYINFKHRFHGFDLSVEQLSRLVSDQNKKRIKDDLASGKCQVIVGTHALLAKTIRFQDLGLVIIDEEQRFGVAQKERLKQLRTEVHVLTLTATPIPRTLQMALSGVREMSLIATPPVDRLSVHTYVMPYDSVVTREALMREYYRGGQSFYVCPRVKDLSNVYEQLQKLVPELKVVTAHGQMPSKELEDVMLAFDQGQYDILLATNIIESGIDIPNANTLIIHRSDMFGLAQLYQIRGRVGRGKQRGYAYLTIPSNHSLTKDAQRRLEVMQTLDSLGAGFQLASHDLDIRGAGNIVGDEQSGHIREVGVELYQQMLEEAIQTYKEHVEEAKEHWVPQLHLGLAVMIPEKYVSDLSVRMQLYRRLAHFESREELESFAAELIDRFGPLPDEVKNLLDTVLLKQLCRSAGVERIDAGSKGAIFQFYKGEFANPMALISYIQQPSSRAKIRPDQKIAFTRSFNDPLKRINGVREILQDLVAMC